MLGAFVIFGQRQEFFRPERKSHMKQEKLFKSVSVVRVELVREKETQYAVEVNSPGELVQILTKFLNKSDREVFLTVNLGSRHEINSINVVSIGTINNSLAHPREVFKAAILANAHQIALAHNHPSGDPQPSSEDLSITKKLQEAGKILSIEVLDHIIIAGEKYISFVEEHIGGF